MEGYQHLMAKPTLLPDPSCLHLQLLDASEATITIVVTTTSQEAECPLCHGRSARIHSRYVRAVADLPWMGCAVRLQLHIRRFFCSNAQCVRQIFTERLPTVVAPYARRTMRLTEVLTLIGFALGGEAGKRLAAGMSLVTSPDTLLRLIRAQPEESVHNYHHYREIVLDAYLFPEAVSILFQPQSPRRCRTRLSGDAAPIMALTPPNTLCHRTSFSADRHQRASRLTEVVRAFHNSKLSNWLAYSDMLRRDRCLVGDTCRQHQLTSSMRRRASSRISFPYFLEGGKVLTV